MWEIAKKPARLETLAPELVSLCSEIVDDEEKEGSLQALLNAGKILRPEMLIDDGDVDDNDDVDEVDKTGDPDQHEDSS